MTQTPKIGIDQFWEALQGSQLLSPAEFTNVQQNCPPLETDQDSDVIADWLVKEKILTSLQTKVISAGHAGPFDFGRYRVFQKLALPNVWLARDRKTDHPVWLHFFRGQSHQDLARWDKIEKLAEQCSSIEHRNFARIYELSLIHI